MEKSMMRRRFLKSSAALTGVFAIGGAPSLAEPDAKKQEYYELRVWRIPTADKQKVVHDYLEKGLLPALGRSGIDRVGVFTRMGSTDEKTAAAEDFPIFVLIPYPTLDLFAGLNPALQADAAYQKASEAYFAFTKQDPAYTRIESKFFKAFSGIPVIEPPAQTAKKQPRLFELRTYESHHELSAALKVEMFNSGETQAMREAGLAPVFFGEALIGHDVPNLAYMLSAANMEEHNEHWKAFMVHPEWQRLKNMPRYKDTVSHITKIYLVPTAYSRI